jgi:hypothetical protein
MTGKQITYWDSSAFLALIKDEKDHGPGEMPALKNIASEFDSGIILLATSTITVLEVLSANLPTEQKDAFQGMLDRSNFFLIEASESIMRSAAEIRRYYYGKILDGNGKILFVSSPDAIHIASAVAVEAESLITFDSNNKPNKREAGMTQVGDLGLILGKHVLSIHRPAFGTTGGIF